jgi:hypothetical protein
MLIGPVSADWLKGLRWRRGGLLRLRRLDAARLAHDLIVGLALIGAKRAAEVADSLAERAAGLWQSLGAEHEQRDNEDEKQVGGLKDVVDEWHRHKLTRWGRLA